LDFFPSRRAYLIHVAGAPECCRSNELIERNGLRVSQKVDIWSLGCVYSEAAVWIVLGPEGIERYRQERKKATEQIKPAFNGGDCFHDGEKVLDIVLQMHRHVQGITRGGDYITGKVLEIMVMEMLGPWSARPSAEQLRTKSQRIISEANERLNGVAHENPFSHTVSNNSTFSNSNGKAREPTNVLPAPWELGQHPRPSRPATWDAPSSPRPVSGLGRPPQRLSADVHGITDWTTLDRQKSLHAGPARVGSYRQPQESIVDDRNCHPDAAHAGIAEIDEDEDESLNPMMCVGRHRNFRAPTLPTEGANDFVYQLPAAHQLPNNQQSFKGKARGGNSNFSKHPPFAQMGQIGDFSTPIPTQNKHTKSSPSPSAKPTLSFAEALKYKGLKKKKKATEEDGLPFYWLLPRLAERDHVCTA
jgi:hypothetical protein